MQNLALAQLVASKLCREWSPEQIAGWLKRTYPDDETYQVSHACVVIAPHSEHSAISSAASFSGGRRFDQLRNAVDLLIEIA